MEGRKTQLATTPKDEKTNVCRYIRYKNVTVYFDPEAFSLLENPDKNTLIKKIANALAYTKTSSLQPIQFYVTKIGITSNNTYQVVFINSDGEVSPKRDINLDTTESINGRVKEKPANLIKNFPDIFMRGRDSAAIFFKLSAELGLPLQAAHEKAKNHLKPSAPKKWSEENYDSDVAKEKFPELASIISILQHREKESDEHEQAVNLELVHAKKTEQLLDENSDSTASTSADTTEKSPYESASATIQLRKKQLEEDYQAILSEFNQTEKEVSSSIKAEANDELKAYIKLQYQARLDKLHADLAFIKDRKAATTKFLSLPNFAKDETPFALFLNQQEEMVYIKKSLAYALQLAANKYFAYAQGKGEGKEKKFNKCFRRIAEIKGKELIYTQNLSKLFAAASLGQIADFINKVLQDCNTTPTGSNFLIKELEAIFNVTQLIVSKKAVFHPAMLEKEAALDLTYSKAHAEIMKESRQIVENTNLVSELVESNRLAYDAMQRNIEQQRRFINNRNRLRELNEALRTLISHQGNDQEEKVPLRNEEEAFLEQDNDQREKTLDGMEVEIELLSKQIEQQYRFINYKNILKGLREELADIGNEFKGFISRSSELSLGSSASGNLSGLDKELLTQGNDQEEKVPLRNEEEAFLGQDNDQREKTLARMEEEIALLSKRIEESNDKLRKVKQKVRETELAHCINRLKEHIALVLERFPENPEWESVVRQERYWKVDHNWGSYKLKIETLKDYAAKADSYSFEEVGEIAHSVAKLEEELQNDLDAFKTHFVAPKQTSPSSSEKGKERDNEEERKRDRDSDNEAAAPSPQPPSKVAASLALPPQKTIKGKIIGALVGAGIGAGIGGGLGALAGFFLAPVTFGASVPVGAAIGAVVGGSLGGLVGGGIIGLGIGHLFDKWWQKKMEAKEARVILTDDDFAATPKNNPDYAPSEPSSVYLPEKEKKHPRKKRSIANIESDDSSSQLAGPEGKSLSTHAAVGKACRDNPGRAPIYTAPANEPNLSSAYVAPVLESSSLGEDKDFDTVYAAMYGENSGDPFNPTSKPGYS